MTEEREFVEVSARDEGFTEKVSTKVWLEESGEENPYLSEATYCYGYDLLELINKISYSDMMYLLLRGDLPSRDEAELFSSLLIAFINPGPRDQGSRAAVQAAIGRTDPLHILPIALSIFAGEYSGAKYISQSMKFIVRAPRRTVDESSLLITTEDSSNRLGYGRKYNDIDVMAGKILEKLCTLNGAGSCLDSALELHQALQAKKLGVMPHGVIAAALCDLGFLPKHAPAVMQLMSAPGMLAHGLEFVGKPRNQVPFLPDDKYEIVSEDSDV